MTDSKRHSMVQKLDPILQGFEDSEWTYYVATHNEDAVLQVDDAENLEWEHIWMRPIRASVLEEYDGETVVRGPDGRFQATVCWIECSPQAAGAEPWTGVRYR